MAFKLADYLKPVQASEQIETIDFADLCKLTKATGFKPSESAKYGSRVHIMKGTERLFAIRLGKSVKLANDFTTLDGLKELINNHVIYHGKHLDEASGELRPWVAFGKKGELSAGIVYSLDEIMAAMGTT